MLIGVQAWAEEEGDVIENSDVVVDEEVTAEDLEISDPKILPDNPLYAFKDFWQVIRTTFTFNPVKKAELRLRYANRRLIEAKKLAEKTGKERIVARTMEKFQKEVKKIETRVEKFKEKAENNPKIDKFLDKYTDKTIKHQRLMDRLEKNLSDKPEVLERIRNTKEKTLEHFGEVMTRLENKEKIQERLEKNLDEVEGSKYKNFKNLEVLIRLEERVPEKAKEAIKQAQKNSLKRLHGNLEQMSPNDQEKFGEYLENIGGEQATHLEIIDKLKAEKPSGVLRTKLEQNRKAIQERVENLKRTCKNLCGDGVCQEIVCQAIGCPCAETARTCSQDCK